MQHRLAVVDAAVRAESHDNVLIEERGVVGRCVDKAAARKGFSTVPGRVFSARRKLRKASTRRSFLAAPAADVTNCAKMCGGMSSGSCD